MFHFEVTDDPIPETPRTSRAAGDGALGLPEESYNLGDKICDPQKYTGLVKYIGPVGSYAGTWLGIEWDDPSRGKHSGSVDGTEYFQVAVPNSGSFIRPQKAKKVRKIKEALMLRYGHEDEAALSSLKSIEGRLEQTKISYGQLKILNLSSKGIEDCATGEELKEIVTLCPNVVGVELADNFIRSWSFIGNLCSGLVRLTRIDFSKNELTEITDEELEQHKNSFLLVDHVILGTAGYKWESVLRLSALWPKLTNLQVPFNGISEISPPTTIMKNITRLDLEGNKLDSWENVLKLTTLERLEYLNICGNAIKIIRFPAETNQVHTVHTTFFSNLKLLNITENSIDDWISVSELNKLKNLRELRIDLNPLLNRDTRTTNRQLVIARLGNIQKLEGVDVTRQERRDAEIDYVKRYFPQWEAGKDSFRFVSENPRYSELVEKWGQSSSGEQATVKTMKSSLLSVTLVCEPPTNHKPSIKKVMPTMTVQKLKGLVQRVFREDNSPTKITVISSRNPGITFLLEDDFMELSAYSVEEGDKLLIGW